MPKTKQPKSKLNVKLLRKIQKHITTEPKRFFMGWFVAVGEPGGALSPVASWILGSMLWDASEIAPACGTAACIAGWANILSGDRPEVAANPGLAAERLNLPRKDGDFTYLFANGDWPEPFRDRYAREHTLEGRAEIACARIDHLIATGE